MVKLGWLQKLDHDNLPNVDANLAANLQSPDWDPNRDYSVPWQSGFTGIAYNSKYTGEVRSFEELLTRSDLKGRVSLLKEMRDTMGFLLKMVDADPEDFSDDEWGQAIERLEKVVSDGQVRRFTGNDYVDDLNKGDIVACEAWSGDVIAMQYDNPDIKWVVPEEGLALWSDNMLVPNTRRPQGQRRGADELLLPARGRRDPRRVGELHLPGRGRPRGDGEDRPQPRRRAADLPHRRTSCRTPGRSCRSTTTLRSSTTPTSPRRSADAVRLVVINRE